MTLFDDFLVRAGFAGLGVALAAAPLGCFVVWRRMAFFGDATAHAAILGVALALALGTPVFAGALVVALVMAIALTQLTGRGYSSDALLGVMSHAALAVGLVAASMIPGLRVDLSGFLFGDILAVTKADLAIIWGGGALVVMLVVWRWQALLTSTLNPDLAHAAGIDPKREEMVLTLTLAIVVAIAIEVVGVLLIGAMLLIPATAARPFATTPERMAVMAAGIGAASAIGGLYASFQADTPTGPTIVSVAGCAFLASLILRRLISPART